MYLVHKSFKFSAAHCLPSLDASNKCTNMHGHNYEVIVAVQGEQLDRHGMVIDFAEMTAVMEPIIELLDHSNLNDHFDFPTTSENLAKWFYDQLSQIDPVWVEVKETPKLGAVYQP